MSMNSPHFPYSQKQMPRLLHVLITVIVLDSKDLIMCNQANQFGLAVSTNIINLELVKRHEKNKEQLSPPSTLPKSGFLSHLSGLLCILQI